MELLIALAVIALIGRWILKKYKPQSALLFGGILLMLISLMLGKSIIAENKETGFALFDIFAFMKDTLSYRLAGLGLMIMSAAGFAHYMNHIQASATLVHVVIKPLQLIKAPYVVLSLTYIVGQILNIFIPSATGLGLLLMATVYPIVTALGVSRLSAAAVIATTASLDLGPASGNSILAASTVEMEAIVYFFKYQLPVALFIMPTVAILHFFTQRYFDKKDGAFEHGKAESTAEENTELVLDTPKYYAVLPLIPLVLMAVFNKMLGSNITMHIVTAMLIGIFLGMVAEFIRCRSVETVFDSIQVFFDGMGTMFAKVVTLIIAGETFANGLKSIGAVDALIQSAQDSNLGIKTLTIIMTAIITICAIIMGSGNAPFFAFAPLVPDIAEKFQAFTIDLIIPMQLSSGIARSISPITGVVVAVAGVAGISPFLLIKRTAIPMIGALITLLIANILV